RRGISSSIDLQDVLMLRSNRANPETSMHLLATHAAPELCFVDALQVEGAGKAGHRLMPVARLQQKKQAAVTTGQPDDRPSLRDGWTDYTHSPRGPGCLAPVTGGSSSPPA
ncbi:hypothetical protein, partial [Bradyrhizobium sp. STM 3809]|uniref:hypothetical protein n=1 Tax=Bradyrhizobium sp. STM 3809 TaxID=551936 RepID=UPI001F0B3B02